MRKEGELTKGVRERLIASEIKMALEGKSSANDNPPVPAGHQCTICSFNGPGNHKPGCMPPSRAEEDRRMLKDLSEKAEELCRKYDVASRQGQSSSRSFLMDLRHLMEGMCEPKDVLELCAVEIEKSSPFDSNVEIAKRIRGMRDFLFCEIRDENHCTFHHCEPSYTCGESDCPHCKGE